MRAALLAAGLWAVSQVVSPVPMVAGCCAVVAAVTVALAPKVWAWTAGGAS